MFKAWRTGLMIHRGSSAAAATRPAFGTPKLESRASDFWAAETLARSIKFPTAMTAVGFSTTLGGSYANAIIWDPTNGLRDLNSLIVNPPSTWTPTDAVAISQTRGLIAGIGSSNISTSPPSGTEHAFVLNGGSLTEIPDPGVEIFPRSVNNSGETAGFYYDSSGQVHAFVYTSQQGTIELQALGVSVTGTTTPGAAATSINDLGTVVGSDLWADDSEHAFIYTSTGGMIDIIPPVGVVFDGAYGINDDGQVISQGYYANDTALGYRGFVLTPTPEPNSIALLVASGAVILLARFARIHGKRLDARQTRESHRGPLGT